MDIHIPKAEHVQLDSSFLQLHELKGMLVPMTHVHAQAPAIASPLPSSSSCVITLYCR